MTIVTNRSDFWITALLSLVLTACGTPRNSPAGAPLAVAGAGEAGAYARLESARSPLDLQDLRQLEGALLFGDADVEALRLSLPLVEPQREAILDVWYGFVASTPQLVQYFTDRDSGQPDPEYLAKVRVRFGQWILDTARAEHDQDWLDRQHEIGLRHHRTKKNLTDGANSVPIIHFRYLPALVYPVTATLRPFLEAGAHTPEQVEAMHQAWIKSVLLQAILWSHPYVNEGEF